MAMKASELDRAAERAARQAAREARAAVNQEVRHLLSDVEALTARLRDVADTEVGLLRARVENAMAAAKHALADQARDVLDQSDRYVRSRPWQVAGMVAAGGLLIGVLIATRRRQPVRHTNGMRASAISRH